MSSLEEIRQVRLEKLNLIKSKGINPFPLKTKSSLTLKEAIDSFPALLKKNKDVNLVGRIMSLRPQGAIIFLHIFDGTDKFQAMLKKEGDVEVSYDGVKLDDAFEFFKETVDVGDFIQVSGKVFITKRNEKTVQVKNWKFLSKSLRPLPEKWHGLQDVEERFRKRYLDILMSDEIRNRFITRSKIISEVRSFLDKEGFLEVETPILQALAGGASAEPFITHHNTLDIDLNLRIAPELYLKKLLIAGFPKVYELGRLFRNEGIDVTHNPEFTNVEFYQSYSDKDEQMALTEKLFKTVVKKVSGKSKISFSGNELDFSKKFSIVPYFDLLKRHALISNPEDISFEDLKMQAIRLGVTLDKGDNREKVMDNIYKKVCRPKIIQPTFVVDYPIDYLPLAKRKDENKKLADAFQVVISGIEMVKAFSELNDPIDQRERFANQEKNKEGGDKEAQPNDEEFIESMEYGMPPAGGVGIGLERLIMLLTDTKNIKEVIIFPTMRPKN